jgi:Asp-tRNA(Asn)/Glu-tRNA(Gln) amidotransferase A subunit family amidase
MHGTDTLVSLTATQVVAALTAGELSAADYAEALVAEVEKREGRIHAFAWWDPARWRQVARDSGRSGLLAGIPVAVKDIIDTAGVPTEYGTAACRGRVPESSATVVRRIEAAGGYVAGKTVTAELAYSEPGPTRNPWNLAHTPGGSSSGSAAAVAAGFVPLAVGTQTNGSVIRPAAFCGVVGFKPSSGLIPRTGILRFSATLDTVGVFARSVEDAARLACCLAGFDAGDAAGVDAPQVLCRLKSPPPARGQPPRLALVRSPAWWQAEVHQREHLLDVASRFAAADAVVEEVALPPVFEEAWTLHRTIMFGEGARALRSFQEQHRAQLSERLNALIDEGLSISDAEIEAALARRLQLNGEMRAILGRFDAILTPPASGEAPATLEHTGDPVFCTLWTLTGLPAVTLPSGFGPNGLPLGVQLVGAYLRDDRLVGVAKWCEEVIGLAPLRAPDAVH